jgi:hypothetical protein
LENYQLVKRLAFLISGILCCLSGMAQQTALSDFVSISLPNRAEKFNKEQATTFANKKFSSNRMALHVASSHNPQYTYKVDDILMSFFTEAGSVDTDHLSNMKRGFDAISKNDKTYTSLIEIVNDNKVLVISETWDNVTYCRFYCFDKTNSKAITGALQFDKADKDNAAKILDDILKSIKFT